MARRISTMQLACQADEQRDDRRGCLAGGRMWRKMGESTGAQVREW